MLVTEEELRNILLKNFPSAQVKVVDTIGDQNHYSVEIKDDLFAKKSKIERHRMVNKALEGVLGNRIHAMQLKVSGYE